MRILELGVGWGDLTKEIFARFPKVEVLGLDNSLLMLNKSQCNLAAWCGQVSLRKVDLTKADALKGLGLFDGIISVSTLHYLDNSQLKSLINQVANCLKPHESFVNSDAFLKSTNLKIWIYWRLEAIIRSLQICKRFAGFVKRIAYNSQSREFPAISVSRKPSLSEYLALLDLQGMESHWRRDDHRFIVVAKLKSQMISESSS